ncbi:MAG TPA: DUF397 domain-containing protein [Actinoplanes sp.]|nr:DUF397 domain-containing protein [Actinoplanes sp.]
MTTPQWRKSTHSSSSACVEVAPRPDQIMVRDSKDPGGPVLTFDRRAWVDFIDGAKAGEFDR